MTEHCNSNARNSPIYVLSKSVSINCTDVLKMYLKMLATLQIKFCSWTTRMNFVCPRMSHLDLRLMDLHVHIEKLYYVKVTRHFFTKSKTGFT